MNILISILSILVLLNIVISYLIFTKNSLKHPKETKEIDRNDNSGYEKALNVMAVMIIMVGFILYIGLDDTDFPK